MKPDRLHISEELKVMIAHLCQLRPARFAMSAAQEALCFYIFLRN